MVAKQIGGHLTHPTRFHVILGILLSVGGLLGDWPTLFGASDERSQPRTKDPAQTKPETPSQAVPRKSKATYRMTGTIRVEGTNEPVKGAKLLILEGDFYTVSPPRETVVSTGADGRFDVELGPGNKRIWFNEAPAGYWIPNDQKIVESLVFGPDQPLVYRDYHVRKGTTWALQLTEGADRSPLAGSVVGQNASAPFRATANDRGVAQLTLPNDGRQVTLAIREADPVRRAPETGSLLMKIEWETNFRPDELQELTRQEGKDRRFHLVDQDAKTATIESSASIEPLNQNGKLVIHVSIPSRGSRTFGALIGQVIDDRGQPIAGAHVALSGRMRSTSDEPRHQATTNAQGRYRLADIPRLTLNDTPSELRIRVTKEGYAGVEIPVNAPDDNHPQRLLTIAPIRLGSGVSIRGVVIDHRGQPVPGASVRSNQAFFPNGRSGLLQAVLTDEKGRFTIDHLQRGIAQVVAFHGETHKGNSYLADGRVEEIRIQLSEKRPELPANLAILRLPPPKPLAVGQKAPEWQVTSWSDGRARKLADDEGKVVLLYFWGISFWPSVEALPTIGQLAATYQPKGVQFLAIHNAEPDHQHYQEQALRVLNYKGAPIPFAIDQTRVTNHARGVTAQEFGVNNYPIVILIDRKGKIAYRSDTADDDRDIAAIARKTATRSTEANDEKMFELIKNILSQEIENVLRSHK